MVERLHVLAERADDGHDIQRAIAVDLAARAEDRRDLLRESLPAFEYLRRGVVTSAVGAQCGRAQLVEQTSDGQPPKLERVAHQRASASSVAR